MNMEFGAGSMVRSPGSQNASNQGSIRSNNDEIQRSNPIWNHEKKRPSNLTFFFLFSLTIIFLISGVQSVFLLYHEIEVVIDYDRDYWGSIEFKDNFNSFDREQGLREFSYSVREGLTVSVRVRRSSDDSYIGRLTIEIYDNGDLMVQRTFINAHGLLMLEYTVGDS
jgi:hypothetical protein